MRERPILFTAPMVRALLAGTKTQTRRALRVQPDEHHWQSLPGYELKRSKIVTIRERCAVKFSHSIPQNREWETALDWLLCPFGQPGDQLWVRESWAPEQYDSLAESVAEIEGTLNKPAYRADWEATPARLPAYSWKPSIHMPRALSRIQLEVTDVRVERVQSISLDDCAAEGVYEWAAENPPRDAAGNVDKYNNPIRAYAALWDTINGAKHPWESNPWVWVVEFRRLKP